MPIENTFRGVSAYCFDQLASGQVLSFKGLCNKLKKKGIAEAVPEAIFRRIGRLGRIAGTYDVVVDRRADTVQLVTGKAAKVSIAAKAERFGTLAQVRAANKAAKAGKPTKAKSKKRAPKKVSTPETVEAAV